MNLEAVGAKATIADSEAIEGEALFFALSAAGDGGEGEGVAGVAKERDGWLTNSAVGINKGFGLVEAVIDQLGFGSTNFCLDGGEIRAQGTV